MSERAIVVVNAGSSSVKFSVFIERGDALELRLRGQYEALLTRPHFLARDAEGATVGEQTWPQGAPLGHAAHVTE